MKYSDLCIYYERLEETTKNLEMRDIVAELFKEVSSDELEVIALAAMGRIYPSSVDKDVGIAGKLMQKIISRAYGATQKEVVEKFKETGDLGKTAEYFCRNKRQRSLMKKDITVEKVFRNLRSLSETVGSGSEGRKEGLVKELLVSAEPVEARYIVRTTIQEMRIGVGEGTVRDAIAKAFGVSSDKVEDAYFKLIDYGKVARIAKEEGEEGLEDIEIEVGRPLMVMLAERSESLEQAFGEYENVALEVKLDGFRGQIHKDGDRITLFSRRLEDKTEQFPEVVEWARECLKPDRCIIDSEIVAVDDSGKPLVFQNLSKRIQRKYDIERLKSEIPVQVNCFDLFFVDGENYMEKDLRTRWKKLCEIVKEKEGKFRLVEHIETDDLEEANKFYQKALRENQEGLMVKNLDASYQPGKRVGYWQKVKEVMEPLDLVIVEGIWGEGKRSNWISSLMLAVRDPDTGEFLKTGKMATGMTEEEFAEITRKMEDLIVKEEGRRVKVRPELVVEVGYEEIQKSPKYKSGYALRFPRMIRFRYNKSPEDADTIERLKNLYNKQK